MGPIGGEQACGDWLEQASPTVDGGGYEAMTCMGTGTHARAVRRTRRTSRENEVERRITIWPRTRRAPPSRRAVWPLAGVGQSGADADMQATDEICSVAGQRFGLWVRSPVYAEVALTSSPHEHMAGYGQGSKAKRMGRGDTGDCIWQTHHDRRARRPQQRISFEGGVAASVSSPAGNVDCRTRCVTVVYGTRAACCARPSWPWSKPQA